MNWVEIDVRRFRWDRGWAEFGVRLPPGPVAWYEVEELQDAWVDFLIDQSSTQKSTFGNIADDNSLADTALELNRRLSAIDTIPASASTLRGYSWVTVCGPLIVERLGGTGRIRASGAFHDVVELDHGGVLLRATPYYRDYDDQSVWRVFSALAPALPPGSADPTPHNDYHKLVYNVDPSAVSNPMSRSPKKP